jgi:hypothetical protein
MQVWFTSTKSIRASIATRLIHNIRVLRDKSTMGVDPFNSHGKKLLIITSCKQLDSTDQEIRSRIDRIFETRLFPRIRVKAWKLSTLADREPERMTTILEQLAHVQLSSCLLALELAFFKDVHKEFSYNSLCAMWESSQLSLLEISLRTNVKGKNCFPH